MIRLRLKLRPLRHLRRFAWAAALALAACPAAAAAGGAERFAEVFPGAENFGPVEGTPPAAAVYRAGRPAGYVFAAGDVVASVGYSGKPFDVFAGIDLDGRITGAEILEHREPILVIGVSDADLAAFVGQYRGLDIRDPIRLTRKVGGGPGRIDAVAGATISSVVFNDAVLRAARAVARSRGLLGEVDQRLDFESFTAADWPELRAEGSLAGLRVSVADAEEAMRGQGGTLYPVAAARPDPKTVFVELYAGLATPARVGRNLIGARRYNRVMAGLAPGEQLVFVAGRGLYSFKGTAYVQGGTFDRIQLVQGERTIRFAKADHIRVEALSVGEAPELRELALFRVSGDAELTPLDDWRLELIVTGESAAGRPVHAALALPYRLPARYVKPTSAAAASDQTPLWQLTWTGRKLDIAVLALGLAALSVILVFQDWVAARKRLYSWVRNGFLVFTLVWIGWIANAQLSVVNVLTFADALLAEFRWDFFLLDPLMFILWCYVAGAMLFWGRGVYCGWLCPFGALQELLNSLARLARVPQWRLPFPLHERLWPIKYLAFLAIFAVFLGDPLLALSGAEIEPFKTAIVLKFARAWPYLLYAGALLVVGLFVSRAFCRYLCPLGAALAIPARMRMFEWLRRRWQCGTPCQHCAVDCPVQSIHPTGQINPNECIHCLKCQVSYYDDWVCPPLVERRKRRERRRPAGSPAPAEGSEA